MRRLSTIVLILSVLAFPAEAHPRQPRSFTYAAADAVMGRIHVLSGSRLVASFVFFATETSLARNDARREAPVPGAWYEVARPNARLQTGTSKPTAVTLDGVAGTGTWTVSLAGLGTAKMKFSKASGPEAVAVRGEGFSWSDSNTHTWAYSAVLAAPVRVKVTGTVGKYKLSSDDPGERGTFHDVFMGPAAAILSGADF